ncbi:MAG: 50S ribosomal protein L3 [Christensenellales bacterium]|jgi:large subunit ribosomal protein L3
MKKAIIGTKLGMSQIFTPDGTVIPVTVIEAEPNSVVQIKNKEADGYDALKVAYAPVNERTLNKPQAGQFKKAGVPAHKTLKELRLEDCSAYKVGDKITCAVFSEGDSVDVTGISKGRGFTGTIQRWNTHRGPSAHGSGYHRGVGSLGANSSPSRVFKNKKMSGQYGNEQVTVQNLTVVRVDDKRNLLFVKGGVPGAKSGLLVVKESVKKG